MTSNEKLFRLRQAAKLFVINSTFIEPYSGILQRLENISIVPFSSMDNQSEIHLLDTNFDPFLGGKTIQNVAEIVAFSPSDSSKIIIEPCVEYEP